MGQVHVGGHCGQTKAGAKPRRHKRAILDRGKSRRHGQTVQVHIGRGIAVRAGVKAQQADVVGQNHGGFGPAQAGAMGLRVDDPVGPGLIRFGIAVMLIKKDQRGVMAVDAARRGLHRLLEIGHDHVDT